MRAYVFEDIDIGGGYTACIAVSDCDGLHVTDYMAVGPDGRFYTTSSEHACQDLCELWMREATKACTIQELHAEQMKRIRGRRALVDAVEKADGEPVRVRRHDAVLGAQTLALCNFYGPQRPRAVDSDHENATLDADWRDAIPGHGA